MELTLKEIAIIEDFVLKQNRETKLRWLIKTLEENNFGAWFYLTKILLKHPIHKGGIETEIIDKIFKNHIKENK